jgi:DNA-binding PadR family transcriptional regulator
VGVLLGDKRLIADREPRPAPTLVYAILALLGREALTGYEIAQRLRDPVGLFWSAGHSQIYPALARIEAAGWATATAGPGPGPRAKKRYELTDAGLAALRSWVEAPTGRRRRDELMLRVFASYASSAEATLRFLRESEDHHRRQLATYLERMARVRERGGPAAVGTAQFADYATLRRGIGFERGRLAWVRWLIRTIEETGVVSAPTTSPASGRSPTARR